MKKKPTTSEKKRRGGKGKAGGRGHKLKVLPETFKRIYPGQDPKVIFRPPKKENLELVAPEPDDEASKLKYPPPKKHPIFRKIWSQFIDNVTSRENFKVGHLNVLELLCDLYVQYDDLQAYIAEHGRSYLSVGRTGEQWKFYPEVQQLNSVVSQIKDYTKMLDLVLKKDHGNESGGEKSEWD